MIEAWQRKGGPWDDQVFTWVVFLCPLFLILSSPWARGIGIVALGAVLARGWPTARRDPVMLAFLGFSLAVVAAYEYGGLGLREATLPHTGWVPTGPYLSCIFFATVALWSGSRPFRRGVMAMLALEVLFGLEEWIRRWPHPSANPYLDISTWRPLWTVATPLAWVAMLLLGERKPAPREGREAAEQGVEADEAR